MPGCGTILHVKQPCVYILASKRRGTFYIGVTSDLSRRTWQHRTGAGSSFTHRYAIYRLVHAKFHSTMAEAILREKRIKRWRRAWKIFLIEQGNPDWRDIYDEINN